MSLAGEQGESSAVPSAAPDVHPPGEVDWEALDKWRFFVLGAVLFSGVSFVLYPAVVLKTRLQVSTCNSSCVSAAAAAIFRREGPLAFYRGFATSLAGTVPARALYMGALEITKSAAGSTASKLGLAEPAAATAASAAAGLSASVAAQVVWTPVDVITQRLMVQSGNNPPLAHFAARYSGGVDAFWKILKSDGLRGLYRGFGMSILAYAPSNAVWWASYSFSQRIIWNGIGCFASRFQSPISRETGDASLADAGAVLVPDYKAVMAVQGVSAAMAGGAAAIITMPLDTIKTRMQVLDRDDRNKRPMTIGRTVKDLIKEGGWSACYRGLGPRWASMSMSATTMITTYEFLKRMSAKSQDSMM